MNTHLVPSAPKLCVVRSSNSLAITCIHASPKSAYFWRFWVPWTATCFVQTYSDLPLFCSAKAYCSPTW